MFQLTTILSCVSSVIDCDLARIFAIPSILDTLYTPPRTPTSISVFSVSSLSTWIMNNTSFKLQCRLGQAFWARQPSCKPTMYRNKSTLHCKKAKKQYVQVRSFMFLTTRFKQKHFSVHCSVTSLFQRS